MQLRRYAKYPFTRPTGMNMDENGFRKFLKDENTGETPRFYFGSARKFERWLFKNTRKEKIEDADEIDIRNWATLIQKKHPRSPKNYLQGLRVYYRFKRLPQEILVKEILNEIPSPPKVGPNTIPWDTFERDISEVERKRISPENLVFLNLLWSEMETTEILKLYVSDIDFEKRLITSQSGKTFGATWKAWGALEKYITNDRRGRTEPLFKTGLRNHQIIIDKYLGTYGIKSKKIRDSCLSDLVDAGRTARFFSEPNIKPISMIGEKQTVESTSSKELFDRLVGEIMNFGNRIHERIRQVKNEEEFKRLLEGYLLATFPDELITPEFPFKGFGKADSKIDFTIGRDPKIPIEAKVAGTKISDHIRKGSGQVIEFLKSYTSDKGILVIGDKERDPERRKHSGMQDNVYIIVI